MAGTGVLGSVLVLLLMTTYGAKWLNVSPEIYQETYQSVIIAALAIPITTITSGLKGILEGFELFKTTNLLKLALGILTFASPMLVVLLIGPNLSLVVAALLASRLLILFLHVIPVSTKLPLFSRRRVTETANASRTLFRFGAWMTLSNIISPLMVVADRFVISNFLGGSKVAYYTVPSEFLLRLLIIPAALTTTLFPIFTQIIGTDLVRTRELYQRSLRTILLVMLPICTLTASLSYLGLKLWLGTDFAENSFLAAMLLCLGIVFNSLAQIPHAVLQAHGSVKTTSLLHLTEFIVYLPLLILSVFYFGIIGAAAMWLLRAASDFMVLNRFAKIKIGI